MAEGGMWSLVGLRRAEMRSDADVSACGKCRKASLWSVKYEVHVEVLNNVHKCGVNHIWSIVLLPHVPLCTVCVRLNS